MTEQKTLTQLLTDIEDATKSHESAARDASVARSRETDALNTVNRLQKEFDETLAKMKKKAPRDSDWNQKEFPPRSFSV